MSKKVKELVLTGVSLVVYIVAVVLNIHLFRDAWQTSGITITSKRFLLLAVMFLVTVAAIWIYSFLKDKVKYVINCFIFLLPIGMYYFSEIAIGGFTDISKYEILINIILIYALYLIAYALMGIKVGTAVLTVILCTLYIVNNFIFLFRGRPVLPADVLALETALTVTGNYVLRLDLELFFLLMIILSVVLISLCFDRPKRSRKFLLIRSGSLAAVGAIVLAVFICSDILPKLGFSNQQFSVGTSYRENGYFLSTAVSLNNMMIDKPDGYSAGDLEEYPVAQYEVKAEAPQPTLVILIMNESWAELNNYGEFETNIGYMDYYESLNENTIKGYLTVPVYGAGTSSSEWEVLTGNTISFLPDDVSAYQLYSKKDEYGLASTMKSQGYNTVAMHPFPGVTWNRSNVYTFMGFNEFHTILDYDGYEKSRNFVTDMEDYRYIIDYTNSRPKGEKTFIFNVTIQSHGGYVGEFDNFNPEVKTVGLSKQHEDVDNYLSLAKMSDDALEYLIEYYKNYDENTMIIVFGDHLPKVDEEFYSEIYGKSYGEMSLEEKQLRFQTPYLIWTNYDSDLEEIGTVSSNYFGSYILKNANLDMSEYNKFQLYASQFIPNLGYEVAQQENGVTIAPENQDIINMYECYQYNYIFGGAFRKDELFTVD